MGQITWTNSFLLTSALTWDKVLTVVDYYQLLNKKIPEEIWHKVWEIYEVGEYDDYCLSADVDSTMQLRAMIGFILELVEKYPQYRINDHWIFSSAA
ncbi:MAG: hypothetical protein OEZ29_02530 [Candidatus Bathyarchaeota archaeon]|nr:hypothetical protein [Candidatus Bathyarchaeota archaeon]